MSLAKHPDEDLVRATIHEKNRDRWNRGVVNGVLTYSTGGVGHLEIEQRYAVALEAEYRRGLRDGKKEIQS